MATKKKSAVGKAAKTPTAEHLTAQIRSDKTREASLKHEAADARRPAVRKHDLAQARSLGKKITSLKHERAERKAKTGLALAPGDVSCCAAQALAMHAWLATGVRVHDEDVLALYWRTAGDPDEGASILDTLRAAREYWLRGARPAARELVLGPLLSLTKAASLPEPTDADRPRTLILGLDLPEGPHAVTAAPDGTWWSWGEPYSPADFAGAVIEDAWEVRWAA